MHRIEHDHLEPNGRELRASDAPVAFATLSSRLQRPTPHEGKRSNERSFIQTIQLMLRYLPWTPVYAFLANHTPLSSSSKVFPLISLSLSVAPSQPTTSSSPFPSSSVSSFGSADGELQHRWWKRAVGRPLGSCGDAKGGGAREETLNFGEGLREEEEERRGEKEEGRRRRRLAFV